MVIFFAVFILICFFRVQIKPNLAEEYMTDYMSIEKTQSIKGIFVLIVFFAHFNEYVVYTSAFDVAYYDTFLHIGQCMVTLFMFYSGYGIMESIRKKGVSYVNRMPVNRIAGTLFRFDIAVILFAVLNLVLKQPFTIGTFLKALIAWNSLGNSIWYIFSIIVAYAITFFAFEICIRKSNKNFYIPAILTTVGIVAYILAFAYFKIKDPNWFNTILCYACGLWYSLLRDKIEKIVNYNKIVYIFILAVVFLGALYFGENRSKTFVHTELCMLLFTATVVLITMRISLHNKILNWCGQHLFEIYILQRIPMILFKELGLADFNIYLYFILCLVVTIPFAWLFKKFVDKLWSLIIAPKKKTDIQTDTASLKK